MAIQANEPAIPRKRPDRHCMSKAMARPRDPVNPNMLKFYVSHHIPHTVLGCSKEGREKIVSEHFPKIDLNQKIVSIIGSDYILIQIGLNINISPLLDLLEPL